MYLKTLGKLELEETSFTRQKPLVLMAYLALEGSKDRRSVAELFWISASDSLNSLSRALSQLRKGAGGSVEADEQRVWTSVTNDIDEFQKFIKAKNYEAAIRLYDGAFLQGAHLLNWGLDLEEWIYEKRESLAMQAQTVMLELAEKKAALGQFDASADLAAKAYQLEGAVEVEPETLPHYYQLLAAGKHPLASKVKQEAQAYGLALDFQSSEAKTQLQTNFIGRSEELNTLKAIKKGEVFWLEAADGMGKTSLLKQLNGTYIEARAGLPYATLEPLLANLEDNEDVLLRNLKQLEGNFLFDDWEQIDQESQSLLIKLVSLKPESSIIIASKNPAEFAVQKELKFGALEQTELLSLEGAWELTGGLPSLLSALLKGEKLNSALEASLKHLDLLTQNVYYSLALQETANPVVVRKALNLATLDMAKAFASLLNLNLCEASGRVRARNAALEQLKTQPLRQAEIAIQLARQAKSIEAYPLFVQSKLFWEESDLEKVIEAYQDWANELLRRGFPQKALDSLEDAPDSAEMSYLKARAFERAGLFQEALECLDSLDESAEVLALKGALFWRLGKPTEAKAASSQALEGPSGARAEALHTLGHLALAQGNFNETIRYAKRAAALWKSLGQQARYVGALSNLAVATALSGSDSEDMFQEALLAAGNNPLAKSRVLTNLGMVRDREKKIGEARQAYEQAAQLAEESGSNEAAALAWNNLGVLFHNSNDIANARLAYEKALSLAQEIGEKRMLGMFMANLAELNENFQAWQEAMRILEEAGHAQEAKQFLLSLPANHPFKRSEKMT